MTHDTPIACDCPLCVVPPDQLHVVRTTYGQHQAVERIEHDTSTGWVTLSLPGGLRPCIREDAIIGVQPYRGRGEYHA